MKTKLLLLITFIGLCFGCSKPSDPDPRDNYIASWTLTKLNGKAPSSASTITIKKETSAVSMSMNWSNSSSTDYVTLSNSSFSFDKTSILFSSDFVSNGSRYKVEFENGTGKLSNTTLVLNFDIKFTNLSNNQITRLTGSDGWIEEYTKK
jgi:hypothetical protein